MDQTGINTYAIPSFEEIMEKLTPELEVLEEVRKEHIDDARKVVKRYNPWYFFPVVIALFYGWYLEVFCMHLPPV
ncbi:MAG: hypothetical protein LIP01_00350 [Tannerellaceae bacterium]|nr:hypothetical protein [Tannerellaceae bacterium]